MHTTPFFKLISALMMMFVSYLFIYSDSSSTALAQNVALNEFIDCRQAYENEGSKLTPSEIEKSLCLPLFKGNAVRNEEILRLKINNGETRNFKDIRSGCAEPYAVDKCVFFNVVGFRPEHDAYIIRRRTEGEGSPLYIVERETGRVIPLPSDPYYSSDKNYFVAAAACFEGCQNRAEVWRIENKRASLQFRRSIKNGNSIFLFDIKGWNGSDKFLIHVTKSKDERLDQNEELSVNIIKIDDIWKFDRTFP